MPTRSYTPSSHWDNLARSEASTEAQVPIDIRARTLLGRALLTVTRRRVYTYAVEDAPKMRWIERAITGTGPLTLDVGVRTGSNAAFFSARGKRCFGIDLARQYVDYCKSKQLIEAGSACNVETDEIPTPRTYDPSLPAAYDLVFFGEIIEHLMDGGAALKKIAGVIRPGGFLIITTPNLAYLLNRLRLLVGRDLDSLTIDHGEIGNQHVRVFTSHLLKRLCNVAGLTVDMVGGDGLPVDVTRHVSFGGNPVNFSIPAPATMSRGLYVRARRR
jgi:2-polyprenyl-3-methyl-5-hydroxy-6-metoxy-1,4-benzoquinol methylase